MLYQLAFRSRHGKSSQLCADSLRYTSPPPLSGLHPNNVSLAVWRSLEIETS